MDQTNQDIMTRYHIPADHALNAAVVSDSATLPGATALTARKPAVTRLP